MDVQQVQAALKLMMIVADAVREAGRIPLGMFYATLMDQMIAAAFESIISQLVGTDLIRREGHELVWVGT
jgi:hypothetical protein